MVVSASSNPDIPDRGVPLREFVQRQLDDMQRLLDERYTTQQRSIDKAEEATITRFASVNEFRAQLGDQARTFMPRAEADAKFKSLTERQDRDVQQLTETIRSILTRLDVAQGTDSGSAGRLQDSRDRIATVVAIAGAALAVVAVVVSIIAAR